MNSMSFLSRWWRTRALMDLQVAFLVTVLGSVATVVTWIGLFRYPEKDLFTFLVDAPTLAASVVSPLLLGVGFWLWLRYGDEKSPAAAIHRGVIQPISRSRFLLSIVVIGGVAIIVTLQARILRTERVTLRVVAPQGRAWRVYPRCLDTKQPEVQCAPPQEVKGGIVVLRLASHEDNVVVESTDGPDTLRFARLVPSEHTVTVESPVPPAPKVDPSKDLVVFFLPTASEGCHPPEFFAQDVVRLLEGRSDRHFQFLAEPFPYEDRLLAEWSERGVKPFLSVVGACDAYQLRLTYKLSQSDFAIQMKSRETSEAYPIFGIPVSLNHLGPQPLALSSNMDASVLLKEYPQQVETTVKLLLGIRSLSDSRPSDALQWLGGSELDMSQNRPADEALSAALRAVALAQTSRSGVMEELERSIEALRKIGPGTADVVATGDVSNRLRRIIAMSFALSTGPKFMTELNKVGLAVLAKSGNRGIVDLYQRTFGKPWVSLVRFWEENQYYVLDEAFRSLNDKDLQEVQESYFAMMSGLESGSETQRQTLCSTVKLPDGRPYSPMLALAETARHLAGCRDCRTPPRLIETLARIVQFCRY